jgi:hypothetical protein
MMVTDGLRQNTKYRISIHNHTHVSQRVCRFFTIVVVALLIGIEPAVAEEIRVPWPVWLLIQGYYLVREMASLQFWAFLGFIVFIPLKKLILGVAVTLGGAFIPNFPNVTNPDTGSVTVDVPKAAKINVKGAPRYAVLAIGILIVLSALWDGISDHASQTSYDFFGDQVTAK